jgi:hypothetical protein
MMVYLGCSRGIRFESTSEAGERFAFWQEFFLDPLQWWWDHRAEKVTEHQPMMSEFTCQSEPWDFVWYQSCCSYLVCLLSCHGLGYICRIFFQILCIGGV